MPCLRGLKGDRMLCIALERLYSSHNHVLPNDLPEVTGGRVACVRTIVPCILSSKRQRFHIVVPLGTQDASVPIVLCGCCAVHVPRPLHMYTKRQNNSVGMSSGGLPCRPQHSTRHLQFNAQGRPRVVVRPAHYGKGVNRREHLISSFVHHSNQQSALLYAVLQVFR